eukprot:528628-Pyramimonas_sp.AAC.1
MISAFRSASICSCLAFSFKHGYFLVSFVVYFTSIPDVTAAVPPPAATPAMGVPKHAGHGAD